MKNKKVTLGIMTAIALTILITTSTLTTTLIRNSNAQIMSSPSPSTNVNTPTTTMGMTSMGTTFTVQKTAISNVDSLPGHQMHQAVVVLPARSDGKIWVGVISWSASKPVEVRLLQNYDSSVNPDAEHGRPTTAPFNNGTAAISLILPTSGAATFPSFNAGSLNFAESQVAFHTLGGSSLSHIQ